MELESFYKQLLDLGDRWTVTEARLEAGSGEVVLNIEHDGNGHVCPECGRPATLHDHAPMRRWRHLDTCQMQTIIESRLPRVRCEEHNVKTVSAPWAEPRGRFTLFFEAFCIRLLQATQKKAEVCRLMNLSFDEVDHIQRRAVRRGLARRSEEEVKRVGLDEKSMKRGHQYLSVLTDTDRGKVLDVVEHRTEESAKSLINTALTEAQRRRVLCVTMDMWQAYENAAKAMLPNADVVFDRFHVSQHLNKAIDQTRRQEMRQLNKEDAEEAKALKNSRYLFLWNMEGIPEHRFIGFMAARKVAEKTSSVWECKEAFRAFWSHTSLSTGKRFLENWIEYAKKKRIPALTKVANMLARKAEGVLNYLKHQTTNAGAESLNGKIQQLKCNARGFRAFPNYRTNILFYFGGLDMNPLKTQ
jgi:transposase